MQFQTSFFDGFSSNPTHEIWNQCLHFEHSAMVLSEESSAVHKRQCPFGFEAYSMMQASLVCSLDAILLDECRYSELTLRERVHFFDRIALLLRDLLTDLRGYVPSLTSRKCSSSPLWSHHISLTQLVNDLTTSRWFSLPVFL